MVAKELDIVKAYKENTQLFKGLIMKGWIDPVRIRDMEIYMEFQHEKATNPKFEKMKAYYKIAIRKNVSVTTVRNAVKEFK